MLHSPILRPRFLRYASASMFDEPEEPKQERALNPQEQAKEKVDEIRLHAELAAVYEGCRKFEAEINPRLDPQLARDIQRSIGRLEKSKKPDSPVLPEPSAADAADLLNAPQSRELSTNDYHIHRRPGEVMMVRWLQGEQVETFYERMQAHFDAAAAGGHRQEERTNHEWKQDANMLAYLAALDAVEEKMADRYLRDAIRQHDVFVLSTQAADEMDILYLADYLMGVPPDEIVGAASTLPDEPTEQDRAWFFKLFALRGMSAGVERMCFFTYMQKSDGEDW